MCALPLAAESGSDTHVYHVAGSLAATPSASTPASASTPDVKATSPPVRQPLSTIDSSRTTPRTAKSDGVADSLKADSSEGGSVDSVRDKCVVMIYDALALDSTAGMSGIPSSVAVVLLHLAIGFYS